MASCAPKPLAARRRRRRSWTLARWVRRPESLAAGQRLAQAFTFGGWRPSVLLGNRSWRVWGGVIPWSRASRSENAEELAQVRLVGVPQLGRCVFPSNMAHIPAQAKFVPDRVMCRSDSGAAFPKPSASRSQPGGDCQVAQLPEESGGFLAYLPAVPPVDHVTREPPAMGARIESPRHRVAQPDLLGLLLFGPDSVGDFRLEAGGLERVQDGFDLGSEFRP